MGQAGRGLGAVLHGAEFLSGRRESSGQDGADGCIPLRMCFLHRLTRERGVGDPGTGRAG